MPLPPAGATHLTNSDRYTSTDVLQAERAVLAAAADRHAGGYATVPRRHRGAGAGRVRDRQRAGPVRRAAGGAGPATGRRARPDTVVGVAGAGKTTLMAAVRAPRTRRPGTPWPARPPPPPSPPATSSRPSVGPTRTTARSPRSCTRRAGRPVGGRPHLRPLEAVLDRWWGIAAIRANPLSEQEQAQLARARGGDFSGLLTRDQQGDCVRL